jgi:hypothetical protein
MKRSLAILIAGIALAAAGYLCVYYAGTAGHASMERSPAPELAWLKEEFHLSDLDFARLARMHDEYLAGCSERCRLIDEKNRELTRLLTSTDRVTPEIERLLSQSAQLRADCQKQMLQHFFEVSRAMPAEQGKRYLTWVQSRTILPDTHATMHH